jgi:hypothetical protein
LTEGSEPASDPSESDWEDDFGFDDRGESAGDSGEEGFGDDGLLAGLELDRLPPLDDAGAVEDEAVGDPFGGDAIAELPPLVPDDEDPSEEIAPGLRATRLRVERVRAVELQRAGRPLSQLVAAGELGVAVDGRDLYVAEPDRERAELRFTSSEAVHALAAAALPSGAFIALATSSGLLCSRDGGRNFERAPRTAAPGMPELIAAVAITRGDAEPVLWAAGADGPLWVSEDGGASFRCARADVRVLQLGSDGAAGLIGLIADARRRAIALRSRRGAGRFEAVELPVDEPEQVQQLQIADEVLLCCRRAPAPQLTVWSEGAWAEHAHGSAPALLLAEGREARAYFWAGARLLRTAIDIAPPRSAGAMPRLDGRRPEVVAELPADAGAPLQLCGHHARGVTTLHAATERAWFRWVVRPEDDAR